MTPHIDAGVFNELRRMTDAAFIAQLVETFLEDAPAQFTLMQAALAEGDPEDLRRAAHSVKSNAATFGAGRLAEMARELEDLAKAGRLEGAQTRLVEIEMLFGSVAQELRELSR